MSNRSCLCAEGLSRCTRNVPRRAATAGVSKRSQACERPACLSRFTSSERKRRGGLSTRRWRPHMDGRDSSRSGRPATPDLHAQGTEQLRGLLPWRGTNGMHGQVNPNRCFKPKMAFTSNRPVLDRAFVLAPERESTSLGGFPSVHRLLAPTAGGSQSVPMGRPSGDRRIHARSIVMALRSAPRTSSVYP
jgi:hypothetical protein